MVLAPVFKDFRMTLMGEEEWSFLIEVVIRTTIMFGFSLMVLRMFGKRAIMEGVFEIALIVCLGSAAGDAMFYSKVGLLPALVVFAVILALYKLICLAMAKSYIVEKFFEGGSAKLIENGEFVVAEIKKDRSERHDFYSDLRLKGVSHIGQIKDGYIESHGKISLFFYPDEEVRYGLPIMPEDERREAKIISERAHYACVECGGIAELDSGIAPRCKRCDNDEWIRAINHRRVQ
jgi:uncharacterized membrane protein YcaP (DUF421 family)